ncbi:GNAT family N-acetyltransferase [Pedobacter chitinilyticus]|uniref:GNAT family N-acetyltransferase n=1 Tax=Pedobacter chitinilyticus TaxID=2233776 RepID=A0A443YUC0_9SPHI|nr:GNAT family N-acetyltransferase [Pedobacter chitinilyticus]RWU07470.1 GNAT family N-acetyltransferase [Pedobacter chitinilyticus]
MSTFLIEKYHPRDKNQLLSVWEKSVLATHHFLSQEDFVFIKSLLQEMDFEMLNVYCLLHQQKVVGFIGIEEKKIEMLFLDPDYIGKGLGKQLMEFALSHHGATLVDVNEQNPNAVAFYQKFGFTTFERTEKDDLGKDYPLLRMKLMAV